MNIQAKIPNQTHCLSYKEILKEEGVYKCEKYPLMRYVVVGPVLGSDKICLVIDEGNLYYSDEENTVGNEFKKTNEKLEISFIWK